MIFCRKRASHKIWELTRAAEINNEKNVNIYNTYFKITSAFYNKPRYWEKGNQEVNPILRMSKTSRG